MRRETSVKLRLAANSILAKNFMMCLSTTQERDITSRITEKNMNMERISCGISGLMRTPQSMARKRWRHLSGISLPIKKCRLREKTIIDRLIEREDVVNNILKEFGVDIEKGHIINGHMPVHVKEGESPVKCNGKVMIIDGGFSKAYRGTTGIAGYTLIYNSRGLRLVSHETFTSTEDVIEKEIDVHSDTVIREVSAQRERVIDTETGRQLKEQISDLEKLLHAYRTGQILEKE